jgi:hypothetical protein
MMITTSCARGRHLPGGSIWTLEKKTMTMSCTHRCCPPKALTKFKEMTTIVLMVIVSLVAIDDLSQPHFGQVWGWSPTLAKLGIWSPPGLPNVQSSTVRPKTPCIEVFLMSLERSWNVDIENGLALVIWTSSAQVMGKRRAGSQTTKSRKSTSSQYSIWECDMALKRSWWRLQLWFRPRHDRTLQSGVMAVQISRSPTRTISEFHFGSPKNLCHFDVASTASYREYYMGEGGGFPRVRAMVNLMCQSARGLSQHPRVSQMLN